MEDLVHEANVGAVAVMVGDLGQRQVQHGDVVGGRIRPAVAGAQDAGEGFASGVQEARQRVVAETFLPGPGRGLLLEWQITMVASMSSTRPGMVNPATVEDGSRPVSAVCAHVSSRARARAARTRARDVSSMPSRTRHAVASEATGPNSALWLRSTARSPIASPPPASSTARSTATRPGS